MTAEADLALVETFWSGFEASQAEKDVFSHDIKNFPFSIKRYKDCFFIIMTSNTVHTTELIVINKHGVTGGAGFGCIAGSGCQCMRELSRGEDL